MFTVYAYLQLWFSEVEVDHYNAISYKERMEKA